MPETYIELSFAMPYAVRPVPMIAASGPTITGQRVNIQATTGRSTPSARSPITRHTTAIAISGSVYTMHYRPSSQTFPAAEALEPTIIAIAAK